MKLSHVVISGAIALCFGLSAQATIFTFAADLSGANEVPPAASQATGTTVVIYDDVLHMLSIAIDFSGLTGNTVAAHIHAGAPPGANAPVATTVPTLPGFPSGTSGSYDGVLNLTLAGSFRPGFITDNGNTPAGAEAALFAAMQQGNSYVNLHTSLFPGGEIRGYLVPITDSTTVPDATATVGLFSFALGVMGLIARRSRIAA